MPVALPQALSFSAPRKKGGILAVILVLGLLGGGYLGLKVIRFALGAYSLWSGHRLNKQAWEAGYLERGLPIPSSGPRDGYWGSRLGKHTPHPTLGWVLPAVRVPGLLDIDQEGMQRVTVPGAKLRLLILGASTAFGGYASSIENTYFAQLARLLAGGGVASDITVFATGAWKSNQEITALEQFGLARKPDVVIFLDGLNDVTNGSNARTPYNTPTKTLDGSRWHPLYHEHDYPERAKVYLENMRRGLDLVRSRGKLTVFVLQPALFEKQRLSPVERTVESEILKFLGSKVGLRETYGQIREQLQALGREQRAAFIDCSRISDSESATVFTDVWHFSDVGHSLLARHLADGLLPILRNEVSQ